ncbi:MAG: Asp-tRNA(Asn)/Glu-tRNA(Gln) amidotransferase subunit GatA [Geminicoccaceae bacterium]|nr:MAG: Asp-tRNA(Asn)/Glu-tRNA(Gln) amidotransferase subunit GatA [Geminicoccaceae bacterium]
MTDLLALSLVEARDGLRAKQFSAVELTQAYLDAMARHRNWNAYITETPDKALAMAEAADVRLAAGNPGPMEGLPIGMKDLFCTEGVRTTAASHILEGFHPPYESTVSKRLWEAGAVCLGKTNLDEFAMGSSNITSYHGAVTNPWTKPGGNEKPLVPGGSSGGSAAAIAGRLCIAATGTDTGGSIRQPAAFSGICGIKPTYGRCSRFGIVAFASSLDQAGAMARKVGDCAVMLGAMAGFDPHDSTSADRPVPDFEAACQRSVKGLKIGIPKEYRLDGMNAAVEAAWQQGIAWLEAAGAEMVDVSLPHTRYALPTYYIIAPAEASSNLARYDGMRYGLRVPGKNLVETYERTRGQGFGAEVQRRILIGTYVLSAGYYDAYYLKAQKVRRLIADDFHQAFQKVDLILTPTAPSAAFREGEKMDDPVAMYLNDVFTVPSSLAGLPAMSVPTGLDRQGLPLGLQLIGRPWDEETVLAGSAALEKAAGFDVTPYGLEG